MGHDVVDAVNDGEEARQTWRDAARVTGARLLFVLLVVSDPEVHRRRLGARDRGFKHVPEPDWHAVQARRATYAPWVDEHVEIDAVTTSADAVAVLVIAHLTSD